MGPCFFSLSVITISISLLTNTNTIAKAMAIGCISLLGLIVKTLESFFTIAKGSVEETIPRIGSRPNFDFAEKIGNGKDTAEVHCLRLGSATKSDLAEDDGCCGHFLKSSRVWSPEKLGPAEDESRCSRFGARLAHHPEEPQVMDLVDIFRAKIDDIADESLTVEVACCSHIIICIGRSWAS